MRKVKSSIQTQRARRAFRVRSKVRGTAERPRLSIFRSNRFTVVQLIDDVTGKTMVHASSRELKEKGAKGTIAALVGKAIAERAKKAGIAKAVADRGSYRYHGRVKALVEAAREAGLSI